MPLLEMLKGFELANGALRSVDRNRAFYQRIWAALWGRTLRLSVTGAAGAGKSVLVQQLTRAYSLDYRHPGTSRHLESETMRLGWRRRVVFNAIPGQDAEPRHSAADRVLQSKASEGSLHVVCNGYNTLRDQVAMKAAVADGAVSVEQYRQRQLQAELNDLDDTCARIRRAHRAHRQPKWMIVVLSKVDLYLQQIEGVRDYYTCETQPFARRLAKLRAEVGSDQFDWRVVPVCSLIEPFEWNGEKLPSQLDTMQDRNELLRNLRAEIESHCD
jgi:hypothetical protein